MLSGCGGAKTAPPDNYAIGEDMLPAVQTEDACFLQKTDSETQQTTYIYQDLESTEKILSQYVETLTKENQCSVIDKEGIVQPMPDFSDENGEVLVGTASESGEGLFLLDIQWTEDSLTVLPMLEPDLTIQKTASVKTLDEIIQIFENACPQQLGLSGDNMDEYSIYPEEGYVFIDQNPFIRLNIYRVSTHSFEKTFVISCDGEKIYELDRDTQELTAINLEGDSL